MKIDFNSVKGTMVALKSEEIFRSLYSIDN